METRITKISRIDCVYENFYIVQIETGGLFDTRPFLAIGHLRNDGIWDICNNSDAAINNDAMGVAVYGYPTEPWNWTKCKQTLPDRGDILAKPIIINKSVTADATQATKEQLAESIKMHIADIRKGLEFFANMIQESALRHDVDKFTHIDQFHSEFITKFAKHDWCDNHPKINRHHLQHPDGVPDDVNLVDVLDMIVDCTMAGMARKGKVYDIVIDPEVLSKAFNNTVKLLISKVEVVE